MENYRMAKSLKQHEEVLLSCFHQYYPRDMVIYWDKDLELKIEREFFIFYIYNITIKIDNILVYDDGWKHSDLKEIKKEVKEKLEKILSFNKWCKKNNIGKKYYKMQKQLQKKEKTKERKKYLEEKQKLLDRTNKKKVQQ